MEAAEDPILRVYATAVDAEEACRIGSSLVEERLTACANFFLATPP